MNLRTPNEHLTQLISRYAQTAMTSRQIARRVWSLFPARYQQLKGELARGGSAGGRVERLALTDPRFEEIVRELTDVSHAALQARIEYETHAMLFRARQSLRALRLYKVR